jgi:hypothetical protein
VNSFFGPGADLSKLPLPHRRVERRGPLDEFDKHGKLAEVQRIDDSVVIANTGSGMVRGKERALWHRENDNPPEWWDQGPEPPPEWQQDPSGMARKQRARRRIELYEFDTQGFVPHAVDSDGVITFCEDDWKPLPPYRRISTAKSRGPASQATRRAAGHQARCIDRVLCGRVVI